MAATATTASIARPAWSWIAPLIGWIMLAVIFADGFKEGPFALVILVALVASVLASVHHAEVIAHRIGEPYGTLVLAVSVTIVELSLIVTLMLAGGEEAYSIARDSVFAAVMIATTGIVGLGLLVSGIRYGEVRFEARGAASALSVLAALAVLTLVMPNYTLQAAGPVFSPIQLAFVGGVSLTLYLTFVFVQTVRHRNYFLSVPDEADAAPGAVAHHPSNRPSNRDAGLALALLLFGLVAVVLLAKALAPTLDAVVAAAGAPRQVAGVAIAALVLLPEGLSAVRAARRNQIQTSLNLALGSALASIGLTIPGVAIFAHILAEPLVLGISPEQTVLLTLTLLVSTTTLANGRSTILQGAVHLTIFVTYLLLSFVP